MKVGIIKKFDTLGRLVIPKELRKRYNVLNEVEIVATEEGILLREPKCIFTTQRAVFENNVNKENTQSNG